MGGPSRRGGPAARWLSIGHRLIQVRAFAEGKRNDSLCPTGHGGPTVHKVLLFTAFLLVLSAEAVAALALTLVAAA